LCACDSALRQGADCDLPEKRIRHLLAKGVAQRKQLEALLERRIDNQSVSLLALSSWQAHRRQLRLASARANRPLVCRNGEVRALDLGGAPLGLLAKWEYDKAALKMQPHDLIVLCSDGITEQENPAGQ